MTQVAPAEVTMPGIGQAEAHKADSIAGELASRMAQLAPLPGDAMDWAALAAAFEREARARRPEGAAAPLLHEAGRIYEQRLGNLPDALAYYRAALDQDSRHRPSLEAARRVAHALGDTVLECQLLEAEAAVAHDGRAATALHLARAHLLRERLGRADEGRAALEQAAAADPDGVAVTEAEAAWAASEGRYEDLVAAYERCAERVGDGALAGAWLCTASDLAEARLGARDRASALAMRAFELAPEERSVRDVARRAAERDGNAEDLARVLEADARAEDAPPRDAALAWCSLARLEDERLGLPDRAAAALGEALRLGGADPLVLDALSRAHEARGDWERLAEVLRRRAEASTGEEAERADIVRGNLRLAEICEERLGRPDEAAACYRAVLALDPNHRAALAALGRLHARAGNWERLLETFLAERDAASDPADRAQRCVRAAQVLEERLSRPADAITLYEEVLTLEPGNVAAHGALERLYELSGRFVELASLLERDLVATTGPAERLSLLFRLARLHEDRLGDREAAARTYQRILEIAPGHVVALGSLAALHEQSGRFPELVAIQEELTALTTDQRKAIALLQRTAEVQEGPLADEAAAAATHERILKLDPSHLPSLRALGRFLAHAGRWEDLVAMYRSEADVLASPESAAALHGRAGAILETKLGRETDAADAYRRALALAPSDVTALRALARLGRERGDWESLVEVLRTQAASAGSADRKAALLLEAGEILEMRLGAFDRAAEAYQAALRVFPAFGPASRALDRVFTAGQRWADLLDVRRTAVGAAPAGPLRASALLDCARLAADRLGDDAAAEEACRAALAEAPGHLPALLFLSRLRAGEARALARTAVAERVRDGSAAASLLVAAALDRGGDEPDGAEELTRAAAAAPDHPVAAPLLEATLRRAGAHQARAAHWEARRGAAADPQERGRCALQAGEAWEDAGEGERALGAYREALEALTPGALAPLHALRRVRARSGAWAEVRATLQEEGDALRDPALGAAAFSAAGEIALSRLADRTGAADDWRRALEREPLDDAMAERLAALLGESGNDGDLCALRELRAGAQRDPARCAEEWVRAAQIAAGRLGDVDRALADLANAIAARADSAPALLLRGRLLASAGRPGDAARDLAGCLALGGGPGQLAEVHLELAALHHGPIPDPARAMSHLNAAVSAAPESTEALSRLARLHREARNWPAAADALRRLAAIPSLQPGARAGSLLDLAEVRTDGFGDPAGALELCEHALQLAPDDPSLRQRVTALRERTGGPGGVVGALEAAASAAPPGPERARAHLRAARVLAGSLGDERGAITELQRALESDPSQSEARIALAELYAESDPALAVEEHRRLLADDPPRVESWRALYSIFRAGKAHDRAFVAAGVLRFLQASAPALDGAFYAENALHAPAGSSQALAPVEWLALRQPGDGGPLAELTQLCGPALAEVAGLHPGSREKLRDAHALTRLFEELCANLAVDPPPLRPAVGEDELWVEPGSAPAVRVGAQVARRRSVGEQRFLLARAAARVRYGSALAARLASRSLGDLVAAAVRQVVPVYDGTGSPSPALVKAVGRALPRKVRKALHKPARALAGIGAVDVGAWQAAAAATADRAGLLLAADIPAALWLVAREQGIEATSGPTEIADAVRSRAALRQLLLFAIGDDHLRLRQRLRLAIA